MKRAAFLCALLGSLCVAPRGLAQGFAIPPGRPAIDPAPDPAVPVPLPVGPVPVFEVRPPPLFAEAEYLLWWFTPAPVSVPLVASPTAPLNLRAATANLTNPDLRVVFGNQTVDSGCHSGLRLRLGLAPTDSGEPGIELGGLLLPRSTDRTLFTTRGTSPNGLFLPFRDTSRSPPVESGLAITGNLGGPFA